MKEKEIRPANAKYYYGLGRRKNSRASVMIYEGTAVSKVNSKEFGEYFPMGSDRNIALQPLKEVGMADKFYFTAKLNGGGIKGGCGALALALARALIVYDPGFKKVLKDKGYLTRDDRMVERKHTGLRKARKRPQYSKR